MSERHTPTERLRRLSEANSELMTQQRELARRLASRSSAQAQHYLAEVAEQMRGPLQRSKSFASMLESAPLEGVQADLARRLAAHLAELDDIVTDISVPLVRLPQQGPRRERLDLTSLVDDTVQRLRDDAGHLGVRLHWTGSAASRLRPAIVLGDAEALADAVGHLLSDVVIASGVGKQIEVGLSEDSMVHVVRIVGGDDEDGTLTDDLIGPQMTPAQSNRRFAMGLAVARAIVERHGGHLESQRWHRPSGELRILLPRAV